MTIIVAIKMKKIVNLLTAIALVCVMAVSLASCEHVTKAKTNCQSGWAVNQYRIEGEEGVQAQKAYFDVTRNGKNLGDIWLNVGSVSVDSVEVTISEYYKSGGYDDITATVKRYAVSRDIVKKSNQGWIKVVSNWGTSRSSIKLSVKGVITINELVVLDQDGNRLSISLSEADLIYKDANGKICAGRFTEEEIKEINSDETFPSALCDEQEKFDEVK